MAAQRDYLLDTNILTDLINEGAPRHPLLKEKLLALQGRAGVHFSVVAIAELRFGFALHPDELREQELRAALGRLLTKHPISQIDEDVTEYYGKLRGALFERYMRHDEKGVRKRRGSASDLMEVGTDVRLGIQENDLWMAAEAMARDMVLVTGDRMNRIVEAAKKVNVEFYTERW